MNLTLPFLDDENKWSQKPSSLFISLDSCQVSIYLRNLSDTGRIQHEINYYREITSGLNSEFFFS